MNLHGLSFRHALQITHADRPTPARALVRYRVVDPTISDHRIGVYAIMTGPVLNYVGSYHNGFIKRWLYARDQYVYHFKHPLMAAALDEGQQLDVFAESESSLKQQLGLSDVPWITASGFEDRLIRDLSPLWNRSGKSARSPAE